MKQKKPKTNDQATQWLWELAIIMGCEPYKLRFALGFMQKTPHTSNCDCFAQVIFFSWSTMNDLWRSDATSHKIT